MKAGEFKLVIRYRDGAAAPLDQDSATGVDVYSDEKYLVLDCPATSLSREEYTELTFDMSETPIPINAIDMSLSLVFKGELGAEKDAVAFGYKDISEPTPFMSLNNTDYVCLKKDGTNNWYQNGDPVLNAIQDEKHCLFHPFTFHIKSVAFNGQYASSSNFFKKYETPPLVESNDYFVLYVLGDTDKEIKCSVWIEGKREPGIKQLLFCKFILQPHDLRRV